MFHSHKGMGNAAGENGEQQTKEQIKITVFSCLLPYDINSLMKTMTNTISVDAAKPAVMPQV